MLGLVVNGEQRHRPLGSALRLRLRLRVRCRASRRECPRLASPPPPPPSTKYREMQEDDSRQLGGSPLDALLRTSRSIVDSTLASDEGRIRFISFRHVDQERVPTCLAFGACFRFVRERLKPSSRSPRRDDEQIGARIVAGPAWSIGSVIARHTLALVATAVASRFLTPEAYGLVGLAASDASVFASVRRFGFDLADGPATGFDLG